MTFDRVVGSRTSRVPISLDDVAARFNAGESCDLVLKAQDLGQQGIDTSSRNFRFGFGEKVARHNESRFKTNHVTTVAGFSYDHHGKVAGVWINDTGGWTDSNRIFISREKFAEMEEKTDNLAFEFSRSVFRRVVKPR